MAIVHEDDEVRPIHLDLGAATVWDLQGEIGVLDVGVDFGMRLGAGRSERNRVSVST